MYGLVRLALAGQPLPGTALAIERTEIGTGAVSASLSPMLAGWSVSEVAIQRPDDFAVASSTEREVEGEVTTPGAAPNTTAAASGKVVVSNAEASPRKETTVVVDYGLLENLDFDERLSQEF